MSNEVLDNVEDVLDQLEDSEVLMSANEFASMGLDPEGIYRVDVRKMAVVTKVSKQEDTKGQKYKAIDTEINLVERFGGDAPGILEYPIRVFDYNFGLRGKKGQRFREFYETAFGPINKTKQATVSLNDLAAACVGVDTVWTTLYWRRNRNNQDEIEQVLGWSFATNPANLKAPKPFAERDKFNQPDSE